jgi:hypothetical protein
MKSAKKWMKRKGIEPKDVLLILSAMIPLTLFVAIGLYGAIGALFS